MFQAFFTGLSGLFSFSKNLDTVSNNIANMNTPGFRGQDTFYRSLTGGDGSGVGAQVSGLGYRFAAGDTTQTGNALDMAIAGNGFFVLMDGDELRYTRAGQFEFKDNVLVDSASGLEVAQVTASGEVKKFDISSLQTVEGVKSTQINFTGNLSTADSDQEHLISGLTVYNSLGEAVEVNFKFTQSNTSTTTWDVDITDKDGNSLQTGQLQFSGTGPLATFETIDFNISDSHGGITTITANFNGTDTESAATSNNLGTVSDLGATVQDGSPAGTLQSNNVVFNADGTVTLKYDNGTEKTGPMLALANFSDDDVLEQVEGAIFKANDVTGRQIGQPGTGSLGEINSGYLELSNVDLSREFADMIIVQRGYQASSRVLNVANQMLEQLYDSTRGR